MTPALWLRDVGSLALQFAAVVGAGALVWSLLRVRHSTASLAYWRVLLAACLLLPICQPRPVAEPPASATLLPKTSAPAALVSPGVAALPQAAGWPSSELLLAVLAGGVALRGVWLLVGACRLRRLRRTAVRVDPTPASFREAESKVGVRAALYVSDRVAGPITFGVARPVVIVPPSVLDMDPPLQEAIACHELVHVRRRDWLYVLGEEAVRTVFWFHPAIWWLIGRIHLSREQVVDEAVIRLTASRDRYVEAMLAVALAKSPLVPAPAPLFLRRRLLKRRIAHLLQETTMTTRRLMASATIGAATLALTSVLAVRVFPLEARSPQTAAKQQGPGPVVVAGGGEHLLHGSVPGYPERAVEQRIEGDVVLDLTIDERGEVSDARVVSGPEELRRAALASVLHWHYAPEKLRSTSAQVVLRFTVPDRVDERSTRVVGTLITKDPDPRQYSVAFTPGSADEKELANVSRPPQAAKIRDAEAERVELRLLDKIGTERTVPDSLPLSRLETDRVPAAVAQAILARAGLKIGDPVTMDARQRVAAAAQSIDEHFLVRFEPDRQGGMVLILIAP